ncbi:MAG: MarR family transcriptional regulator, partial [Candidatus Eremiobacteraeota bacterium]|nr:MarR family transcriptional regulator [Candidatus Eremiobacteraeota bacterium]
MANTAELLAVGSDRSPARAREDYVKAIYQLGTEGPVRAAALARYLNVSRVSVSKAKRQLEAEGLLEAQRDPMQPLRLSRRGEKLAIAM